MPIVINVNYNNNFPAEAQTAFQRAVNTWQGILNSPVAVRIEAFWDIDIGGGLTAMNIPNAVQNFRLAPICSTWFTSALADKLAQRNLQPGEADMAVFFDSQNFQWYTGDQQPQPTQYDLQSVALHEICHGLGFVGLFWAPDAVPVVGSYGNDAILAAIPPNVAQLLPFQLPASLQDHPSVYGVHIQVQNGNYLTDPDHFLNPSPLLGAALTDTNGVLEFDQNQYQVYVPDPFEPFSSVDHLDPVVFPTSLMRPSIGAGQVTRQVDVPVQNILTSLGW